MIIYSFDVGSMTGVCKYDTKVGCTLWTVPVDELMGFISSRPDIVDVVIIERMPKFNNSYFHIIEMLEAYFRILDKRFIYIAPSTWKPISKKRDWIIEDARTDHEQDAYCMCKYYLEFLDPERLRI